jgi:hypothetical protein
MATEDWLKPYNFLLRFLRDKLLSLADERKQQRIVNDRTVAVATILVATTTATGIAILSASITASLADKSAPQPSTDQSTSIIQLVVIPSTADAETLPPTAKDVPACEIRAPEPASRTQETDETSSEALFRKFQAWNAEQDARELAKPLQIHPAPVAKNASASTRPQKHQRAETKPDAKQTQSLAFLKKLLPF